jgi:hypothetical protein
MRNTPNVGVCLTSNEHDPPTSTHEQAPQQGPTNSFIAPVELGDLGNVFVPRTAGLDTGLSL